MDKYLSVITNFGCHWECPYCIVRENGINVPKSTMEGLNGLESAIKETGATIVSISGGGDPLYGFGTNVLVPMYLGALFATCVKADVPVELHTSYFDTDCFLVGACKRVVYHLRNVADLLKVKRRENEIVRVVFVVTANLTVSDIEWIAKTVLYSDQIDELSFRQMVDSNYQPTDYHAEFLRAGHEKGIWYYIEQCDYNTYYAENRIYTKFSDIGKGE